MTNWELFFFTRLITTFEKTVMVEGAKPSKSNICNNLRFCKCQKLFPVEGQILEPSIFPSASFSLVFDAANLKLACLRKSFSVVKPNEV